MMPLCFICFSLCFAIQLMDRIEVIVSCLIFREPMSLVKPLFGMVWAWCHTSITERIVRVCMVHESFLGVGMQHRLR